VEEDKLNLLELGKKIVKKASGLGVGEVEVYLSRSFGTHVEIERGQIIRSVKTVDEGFGVRVSYNKALGFSYTNLLDEENIEKTVLRAFHVARTSQPNEDWKGFPQPAKLPEVKNVYDHNVAEVSLEEVVDMASKMLDSALKFDERVVVVEGSVGVGEAEKGLVNSNGVEFVDRGTWTGCFLGTIAKDGENVTPVCFESEHKRTGKINQKKVGLEAAKYAVSALNAKSIETGNYELVFGQHALVELLYYTLVSALKADNVQRGKSKLKGKIGMKVASEKFTVYDDGLLEGGLSTWKFDDEGTVSQKTILFEKGILKSFLYDKYTADKDGVESTGNAHREPSPSYMSTPRIEPTNLVISPGKNPPEKLLEEITKGIYVPYVQGAHSSNPESGEFSVVATPAWMIKDGEKIHPLKGVMVAGNIYEILQNIVEIANNLRKLSYLVAPWVRVANVKVVGR